MKAVATFCGNFLLKTASLFVLNTMVRRMKHLTQKDIGYLLYIRYYEGWSNFLLKAISLLVPNTLVKRVNHLTQIDICYLLYIEEL